MNTLTEKFDLDLPKCPVCDGSTSAFYRRAGDGELEDHLTFACGASYVCGFKRDFKNPFPDRALTPYGVIPSFWSQVEGCGNAERVARELLAERRES